MPANDFWNIAFGAYSLSVNRRDRTYSLTETASGTVWATALPIGFVEITERESGVTTRYPFGDMKTVSLSEKAGANGKRILFGLDAPGAIPVDVYLTCTEREIQLTVEASRDTRTHRVERVVLLPGLCHVPDDNGASYLVIPHGEGVILTAENAPTHTVPLRIWDAEAGLIMPFVGAVRGASALALLTDSAYAVADLSRTEIGATLDLRYERDPERRRLDVRIVLLPGGDYVAVARAYRDKLIGDGGHVSLRKKRRDRPATGAVTQIAVPTLADTANRWRVIDDFEEAMQEPHESPRIAVLCGDWASPYLDGWLYPDTAPTFGVSVPLLAVVYRDATPFRFDGVEPGSMRQGRAALYLAESADIANDSVGAFLVAHRFLTPDFAVEEARYSNGTVVVCSRHGD